MELTTLLAFATLSQVSAPVLWMQPDGNITMRGQEIKPQFSSGTRRVRTSGPVAFDFDGKRAGILFGDLKPLALTNTITVCTWIYARSYVNDGPGAQLFFRGDDRIGVDPYWLVINHDGAVRFNVQQDDGRTMSVAAEMPLNRWTHIMASFEAETGRMKMYANGEFVAMATTSVRPFLSLDKGWTPGVSAGNVQNNRGPHNQPFNGQLADLRVYDAVLTPEDIDFGPGNWFDPPVSQTAKVGSGM